MEVGCCITYPGVTSGYYIVTLGFQSRARENNLNKIDHVGDIFFSLWQSPPIKRLCHKEKIKLFIYQMEILSSGQKENIFDCN